MRRGASAVRGQPGGRRGQARGERPQVRTAIPRVDERFFQALDREQAGVDRRRRVERVAVDAPKQPEPPPGFPPEGRERAGCDQGALARRLVLDQHVGAHQPRRGIVEQPPQDPRAGSEGQVADDPEGLGRQGRRKGVGLDDAQPGVAAHRRAQMVRARGVELDRDDPPGASD